MNVNKIETQKSLHLYIRSILLSSKEGILLSDLEDGYKKLFGVSMPFESFGFNNLETFLRYSPDYVVLKKKDNLFAEAVSDSTWVHLSNLMSKRKRAKPSKIDELPCSSKRKVILNERHQNVKLFSSSLNHLVVNESSCENDKDSFPFNMKFKEQMIINRLFSGEVDEFKYSLEINQDILKKEISQIYIDQVESSKETKDLKIKLENEMRKNLEYYQEMECLKFLLQKSEETLKLKEHLAMKQEEELQDIKKKLETETNRNEEYFLKNELLKSLLGKKEECLTNERYLVLKLKNQEERKIQEVKELKMELEKEMKIKEGCFNENKHLKLVLKAKQKLLTIKTKRVKTLKKQVISLQVNQITDREKLCLDQIGECGFKQKELNKKLQLQNSCILRIENKMHSHFKDLKDEVNKARIGNNIDKFVKHLVDRNLVSNSNFPLSKKAGQCCQHFHTNGQKKKSIQKPYPVKAKRKGRKNTGIFRNIVPQESAVQPISVQFEEPKSRGEKTEQSKKVAGKDSAMPISLTIKKEIDTW